MKPCQLTSLRTAQGRRGVTFVEILVLLVIMAIVLCLLMPALVGARERKRRLGCQQKLAQLIIAMHGYESAAGYFPPGVLNPEGPIRSVAEGMHHGWIIQLLPFLDEQKLFNEIDPNVSIYDQAYDGIRADPLYATRCPSAPVSLASQSSYAACHHDEESPIDLANHGVFFLNSQITKDDILDGEKFTLFLGEKRSSESELGWMSGTRSTLRNTGSALNQTIEKPTPEYVGGFGSWHANVTHLSKGDGSVTAHSNSIDPIVYQQLGHRSDGSKLLEAIDDGADENDSNGN